MSIWFTASLVGIALLVGIMALRRRVRPRGGIAPDSTTQVAALQAAVPEPAPARSDGDEQEAEASAAAAAAEQAGVRAETLRALREVAFGVTMPPATAAPSADELCGAVGEILANIVDKPNYAPRRPMQLPRLMQAINDESASRREFSQIIAGDPALAGNLLRLANSPFYRHSPQAVESLDRAVDMLGTEGLRSMIAAALLQPVFRVSGASYALFGDVTWEHSLYAAAAAEAHAALVEDADPFAGQLLALLIGLATIVIFSVARDQFLARNRAPQPALIATLIDAHAVSVARQVATSWALSERIDTALAEQLDAQTTPATALGRCLQFGEFVGALAVLRGRGVIDDQTAQAVLQSADIANGAGERIWARLNITPR
ncbi:MAG TPA: HDOD domain-containing protein [Steroidobacteraceae bacterium]